VELLDEWDIVSIGSDEYYDVELLMECSLVGLEGKEDIHSLLLLLPLASTREGQVMLCDPLGVEHVIEESFVEQYIPSSLGSLTRREATTEVMSIDDLTQLRLCGLHLGNLVA